MTASERPRYTIPDAARYVRMNPHTLGQWLRSGSGAGAPPPILARPDADDPRLSYFNLVEAYVAHAIRREIKVSMQTLRRAAELARKKFGIERLFLSDRLRVREGNLLLEIFGGLVNLGRSGQFEIPEAVLQYLKRVEFANGLPVRFYPLSRPGQPDSPRLVVIRPEVGFGRPVTSKKSISAEVIADRFAAGESIAELAGDYELDPDYIEEALRTVSDLPLAA